MLASQSQHAACDTGLTAGPFSDSGLGTWAQSDAPPNISDKISQPMSELDNIDSG